MDWVRQRWAMTETDLDTFEFESRRCQVVTLKYDPEGKRMAELESFEAEEQWLKWLNKELESDNSFEKSTMVLLGGRIEDGEDFRNPMNLRYLPFSRSTFEKIMQQFHVHESIARVINRNYAASFSKSFLASEYANENAIVYTCRSTAYWANDLALSVTHFPDSGSTYGIFYGCSENRKHRIALHKIRHRLITESEGAFTHPMLLMGVFAEIERQRMVDLVRREREGLMESIDSLKKMGYGAVGDLESPVSPWLTNYEIKNGMEHWASILSKMIAHIDELEQWYYAQGSNDSPDGELAMEKKKLRDTGRRIKDRLDEILLDYQEMIRDYVMITDGLTLATNLVLARDNVQMTTETIAISNIAVKDGKQMKSIALLTMVFLPATFVATLFSMSFFQFDSTRAWLYPVVAVPLTIVVLAIYVCVVILPSRGKRPAASRNNSLRGRTLAGSEGVSWSEKSDG